MINFADELFGPPTPGESNAELKAKMDQLSIKLKIRAAIKVECDRQHVGEDRQVKLNYTYDLAHRASQNNISLELRDIQMIAGLIEPDNGGWFRTTPVTFNGTVGGVSPDNIPRAMEQCIEDFNLEMRISHAKDQPVELYYADCIIKEFLDIHPFSDGNGRTAWLLRVWLLNQWDDPQPLPDYYGEN